MDFHVPQSVRPVLVGADLGRTPLSAALSRAGHSPANPTLFVAGAPPRHLRVC